MKSKFGEQLGELKIKAVILSKENQEIIECRMHASIFLIKQKNPRHKSSGNTSAYYE